jgi:hypothetical protein
LKHLHNNTIFACRFTTTGFILKNIQVVEYLDYMFQKNMENVSLSVKEEIADETKNGSSILHHDIGVLEEDPSKVNVRQIR